MTDTAGGLRDEPFAAEVLSSEVGFRGLVWDVRSDRLAYNGAELTRQYVTHPGAAAVVAVDAEGRVLLIQQYRHPIRARGWEIPAGMLDVEGESPEDAARRELAEEVDLTAARWDALGVVHLTPGGSTEAIHLFLARDLSVTPDAFAREAEEADIRRAWVPLAEAERAVADGSLGNATLGLGIVRAAARLRADA